MTISRSQMNRQLYYGGGEGIASLDAGAPSIKYEGDIKPQMASAPDPMADLYDQFLNMKKQGVIPADMDFDSFKDLIREQSKGGIMDAVPREQALLGGLKKAVKSVTKGIGDLVSSDLGKAALIGAGAYYGIPALAGKSWGAIGSSLASKLPSFAMPKLTEGILGKGATLLAGSALMTKLFGSPTEAAEMYNKRPEVVTNYLTDYYKQVNPDATDEEVADFVARNTSEYRTSDTFAYGGRVKYAKGTNRDQQTMELKDPDPSSSAGPDWYLKRIEALMYEYDMDYDTAAEIAFDSDKYYDLMPDGLAKGGRPGYAMGDTAKMAAGIEGLPYRQNPAGVGEIDLRDSGGFIPPVGVKE